MLSGKTKNGKKGSNNKQMSINLHQIEKTYTNSSGGYKALKSINLEIKQGEFVGIIGRSGSGKSTLINMITGIDRPSGGEILVGDTAVHKLNENQMAYWRGRNLGIVFQFFQLLPNLSVIDNVRLPMDFCRTYPAGKRRERAMKLLEMVEMAEHAYKLPSSLSGGQQQRVAIARALANDPPIIIADEPTGNLDSKTADSVFNLFKKLTSEGKTVVMVTHDSGLARRVSRTVIIADGEVVNEYVARALPSLSPNLMLEVSRNVEEEIFAPGEIILHEHSPENYFYIVTEGSAEVSLRRPNGTDIVVDRMGPGQYFGEISLFTSKRTNATVRASVDSRLKTLTLTAEMFQKLLNQSVDFNNAMQSVVTARLEQNRAIIEGKEPVYVYAN